MWGRDHHPLQCAFSLERLGPPPTPPQLSCKISVRQVKGRQQILQVYTPAAEVSPGSGVMRRGREREGEKGGERGRRGEQLRVFLSEKPRSEREIYSCNGVFPPAAALRPSRPWPCSEGAVWPSSVKARISTATSTLMVGRGLSHRIPLSQRRDDSVDQSTDGVCSSNLLAPFQKSWYPNGGVLRDKYG